MSWKSMKGDGFGVYLVGLIILLFGMLIGSNLATLTVSETAKAEFRDMLRNVMQDDSNWGEPMSTVVDLGTVIVEDGSKSSLSNYSVGSLVGFVCSHQQLVDDGFEIWLSEEALIQQESFSFIDDLAVEDDSNYLAHVRCQKTGPDQVGNLFYWEFEYLALLEISCDPVDLQTWYPNKLADIICPLTGQYGLIYKIINIIKIQILPRKV